MRRVAKYLNIALAGNANVGKSALFNALTGMHQHIGNWPGKTIERAEGTFFFMGHDIDVIDLPGIYSLTTFSEEERISRKYIAAQKPDVIVNVVDANQLERNLFFTLQLIELGVPVVVALNQVDLAEKDGIVIDHKKLEKILGVPVVPTVAIRGTGLPKLLAEVIQVSRGGQKPKRVRFCRDMEKKIAAIKMMLAHNEIMYPPRWLAVKLLEGDSEAREIASKCCPAAAKKAGQLQKEIERKHGTGYGAVVTEERYGIAANIAKKVIRRVEHRETIADRLDDITTNKVLGYPIMAGVLLLLFYVIFAFGDWLSGWMIPWLDASKAPIAAVLGSGVWFGLIWSGVEGLIAGLAIALPYIIPFYIVLSLLEDSGYMSRIAFLMDNIMHKIGLHGKAFIPMLLGFGCNVPACLGCRIMERPREKFMTAFLVTLVPCAARTVIIMGLVGAYLGIGWAAAVYALDAAVILILGRLLNRFMPGEPVGLIMEMGKYHVPSLGAALKQAWFRVKEFMWIAFPLIVASSVVIKMLDMVGWLGWISHALAPVTVGWLGLPEIVGIILVFGILRKELVLVILAAMLGTTNFAAALTPLQMVTLAVVSMLYIPCIATIAALKKEFGWAKALSIAAFEVVFAVLVGGIVMRLLAEFVF